ncbi:MAG: FkbM family methyltransferase [Acidobacteriota bacterium]|nr:FkbM family methyltransferase [Acidobacteriota bacterium]
MKSFLSTLYFKFAVPLARRAHCVRAGSLYHLAAYHLRATPVHGVVDGGAFDGRHSLYLARLFPAATIFSFEPAPESYRLLAETAKRSKRIVPVNLALADAEASATINLNSFAPTNSLLPSVTSEDAATYFAGRGETISSAVIQTTTLDQFARRRGDFNCTLLKLDLQGYELHALRGARDVLMGQTAAVISEVRFKPLYEGDADFAAIDAYLAECGFALACLQEVTHHPADSTIFEANALWVKR